MVYTIQQRNIIQEQLINKVQDLVNLYSTRFTSLRGRATIMNTLIMTKIWYCMRLLNPTQAFINTLKSIIYKFVWQQKHPLVSYTQSSLPKSQGGVGLLHPSTQSQVLQIRHLRHIFYNRNTSVLVQSFFKAHLAIITPAPLTMETSFFIPEWRKHELNHPTSIVHLCYKAFDHFRTENKFSTYTVSTLLLLPLHYLIKTYPDNHWLTRHKKLTANNFFIYDSNMKRLRIRVEQEFEILPRLCRQLKKEILDQHTVTLQPFLYPHILNDVDEGTQLQVNLDPMIKQFRKSQKWLKYSSSAFRIFNIVDSITIFADITFTDFKTFWSTLMLLQARSHRYRALSKKLPTATYLQKIGKLTSPLCRLCQLATETLNHFTIECAQKQLIWETVLNYQYPNYSFTPEDILATIYSLKKPFTRWSPQHIQFQTTISTTQYFIRYAYWQLILNNTPFNPDTIVKTIYRQIPLLLNGGTNLSTDLD